MRFSDWSSDVCSSDLTGLDVRQIQLFSYFCWLSWGPSIPICACREWGSPFGVVQFGYGDENNSIEVVGKRDEIGKALAALLGRQHAQEHARLNDGEQIIDLPPFFGMRSEEHTSELQSLMRISY